jgi:hypothetical protein
LFLLQNDFCLPSMGFLLFLSVAARLRRTTLCIPSVRPGRMTHHEGSPKRPSEVLRNLPWTPLGIPRGFAKGSPRALWGSPKDHPGVPRGSPRGSPASLPSPPPPMDALESSGKPSKPRRPQKAQKNRGGLRRVQENPGGFKRATRAKEGQEGPRGPRKAQESPGGPRKTTRSKRASGSGRETHPRGVG